MKRPIHVWVRFLLLAPLAAIAVTLLWADATDEEYEKAAGLEKALKPPATLEKDPDVEGKTFEVDKAFAVKDCKAKFEFVIAKKGTFPNNREPWDMKGSYVKIKTTFDKAKCEKTCQEVKTLQVVRNFEKDAKGNKVSTRPETKQLRERAGWDDPNAASRGWNVDTADNAPFYGPNAVPGSAESGSTDTPSVERDAPALSKEWRQKDRTNEGKEVINCAVCVNKGQKAKIIACLTWGFYIDKDAKIAFDPKPPVGSGTPPQEVKDALNRFEQLTGNTSADIQF